MKKLLLLLLLCPLMAMAGKFYPGTITFNDGSTKQGQIELPAFDDKKIEFRISKKDKSEKFVIDDVKMFTIKLEKEEATYYTLKTADLKTFTKKFKISERKYWVRMVTQGKGVSIVSTYSYTPAVMGAVGSTGTSTYALYFWKPENDYCSYFYADMSTGLSVTIGAYKALVKGVELNFNEECPELAQKMDKDDIKKNGFKRIVELYDENCGNSK